MKRDLGANIDNVCTPLYDKLQWAGYQLESKARTIINIDTYDATVLIWALEDYMKKRHIWEDKG